MGTLEIVRQLLFHIQGESHPIYAAERRSGMAALPFKFNRWGGYLFVVLVIGLPLLALAESQLGFRLSLYRELLISGLFALVGGLLSLGWTVPLAMLAGRGISRERTAQTWDALLVTPHPTETILLAKAAADIEPVWKGVLSLTFIASLPGLFFAGPIMLFKMMNAQSPWLGILFMLVGSVALVVEREQEVALSVTMGIAAAFISDSRRVTLLVGLIGGLLIRLVQTLLTLILVRSAPLAPLNLALLNVVAGSSAALAAVPGFESLIFVVGMIAAREGLIRTLFAWTVRRAHEG
jgi:hypothetical protein